MNNEQSSLDTRKLLTGKDGKLFVTVGNESVFLAEVDTFQVQMNVTNVDYQPVGSILSYAVPTGVSLTLTLTEAVIRDDVLIGPLVEEIRKGAVPVYDFSGAMIRPYDAQEERQVFRNCTPDGTIDLMNLTPGEIIKRAMSYRVNALPEILKAFETA